MTQENLENSLLEKKPITPEQIISISTVILGFLKGIISLPRPLRHKVELQGQVDILLQTQVDQLKKEVEELKKDIEELKNLICGNGS